MTNLEKNNRVLGVETSVAGQGFGDDEHGVGKGLDTHLGASLD